MKKKNWVPYVLSIPFLVFTTIFVLYPTVQNFYISTLEWDGIGDKVFVGLDNYKSMLTNSGFWESLWHTLVYAFFGVIGNIFMGLFLALAIAKRRGRNFYRVVFYIPVLLSGTAVALIWSKIYEPYTGILNTFLKTIGLEQLTMQWLGDSSTAMGSVLVAAIWKYCGFAMILLLTAILAISDDIYEAAKMDGVNVWQEAWMITIPLIKPVLSSVLLLQIINSMKAFDMIWVMTAGGPGTATTVLTLEVYQNAFKYGKYGMASTMAVALVVVIVLITIIYNKISDKVGGE